MIIKGKIKKIKTAPSFKHHQWWVYVEAESEDNKIYQTFVTGSNKLEVIKNSKVGNEIEFVD